MPTAQQAALVSFEDAQSDAPGVEMVPNSHVLAPEVGAATIWKQLILEIFKQQAD